MFSKMTKGPLIALMAILKMNTARNSGKNLSEIGIGRDGICGPQLIDVLLIEV